MVSLRQKLRLFVTAWLVFQAASFSALVPRNCCAEHRPAAKSCHEPPPPATHCPMPSGDGTRCPMHQGHGDACRLRGTCGGPMTALFTVLSHHGILSASPSLTPAIAAGRLVPIASEMLVAKLVPPEPPPPRA